MRLRSCGHSAPLRGDRGAQACGGGRVIRGPAHLAVAGVAWARRGAVLRVERSPRRVGMGGCVGLGAVAGPPVLA
eukprot:5181341-Lingulodinium_polyedra.AAC.1